MSDRSMYCHGCDEDTVPASEHQRLEAACGEMRGLLQELHDAFAATYPGHLDHPTQQRIRSALSSTAGKGWVSPEQARATEAACARYRQALEAQEQVLWTIGCHDGHVDHSTDDAGRAGGCKQCVAEALRKSALSSSDAGAPLLEEVQGLRAKVKWYEETGILPGEKADMLQQAQKAQAESATLRKKLDETEAKAIYAERRADAKEETKEILYRDLSNERRESADLRARLERAEEALTVYRSDFFEPSAGAAEVRRAVEEMATEMLKRIHRTHSIDGDPETCEWASCVDARAIRSRSRGGA